MSGNGDPTPKARKRARDEAIAAGHRILYGRPDVLQLDIDSDAKLEVAVALIARFTKHLDVLRVDQTKSKSGNYHLYVHLGTPLDRGDRIFWQAALGSDRVREALNWLWMRSGHTGECFLVETEK